MADRLLSPEARVAVAELLSVDVDKFGALSGRRTLEAVADWADEVSGTPAARPRWHYDDAPVCGSAARVEYCPDGQCNTAQLERLVRVVGDTRATLEERNEALKWIVHLVGDIHQPLHAADNGDRGGNLVTVALAGVRTRGRESLHRAWDNELVGQALHAGRRRQPPADIDALADEARSLAARAGQGAPGSWAQESNELARTVAYHYPAFACGSVPSSIVVLDRDYQARAAAIIRERLLLAGARLAGVLNAALAPRPSGVARRSSGWRCVAGSVGSCR
jgi:hypothetical protein